MGWHELQSVCGIARFSQCVWDCTVFTMCVGSHMFHLHVAIPHFHYILAIPHFHHLLSYHTHHTMSIEIPPLHESGKDDKPTGSLPPTHPLIGLSLDAALSAVATELENVLSTVRNALKKQLRQSSRVHSFSRRLLLPLITGEVIIYAAIVLIILLLFYKEWK